MATASKSANADPLCVKGDLNIYTVAGLKAAMLAAVNERAQPVLDLSLVSEMDSAGLQLLLLLKREADRLGHPLRCTGVSAVVAEIVELCNLPSLLEKPAA